MPIVDWKMEDFSKGPWFRAQHEGERSCCGETINVGDIIRADGDGGYEGECCVESEN